MGSLEEKEISSKQERLTDRLIENSKSGEINVSGDKASHPLLSVSHRQDVTRESDDRVIRQTYSTGSDGSPAVRKLHSLNNNNNVHLSCAHQRSERSHYTY